MRSDATLPADEFRHSSEWQCDPFTQRKRPELDERYSAGTEQVNEQTRWHSFSGHERNSFFLNRGGTEFQNISAISGLDHIADSRSWVRWDFDRDGQTDIAMANANYPLLSLYRNEWSAAIDEPPKHFLALRFVGSNWRHEASPGRSARDAVGARVTIQCGSAKYTRTYQCGEGFAAQNSATLVIGTGDASTIDLLTVTWPSGHTTHTGNLPADQLVVAYERAEISPTQREFTLQEYRQPAATALAGGDTPLAELSRVIKLPLETLLAGQALPDSARVIFFTTTATWCEACHRLQPAYRHIATRFAQAAAFYGVPIDPIETEAELTDFAARTQPAYALLVSMPPEARDLVTSTVARALHTESLPCTLAVDREGNVLQAFLGIPTASDVGRLVRYVEERQ